MAILRPVEIVLGTIALVGSWIVYRRWAGERRAIAMWTSASEARARELFFEYDGPGFAMWHEGFDTEYEALHVPREVERKWMRELTAQHVGALDKPGNWQTLRFLHDRWDYRYIDEVLAAEPLGDHKVVYMLLLLDYVGTARRLLRASKQQRRAAGAKVLAMADELRAVAAAGDASPKVVEELLQKATRFAR